MNSRWNEQEAIALGDDALALRVYSSRLLGADPALVLHGGGNTSVKIVRPNLFGEDEQLLLVKGSGWDLATIEAAGFAPVQMQHLLRLAQLEQLSDIHMANELRRATIDPNAPAPSVEAILHALLPAKFVDHSHADAIISLTNTPDGEQHIRRLYGDRVLIIPYIMPGFALARLCAELFAHHARPHSEGMVLLKHGLFTWGQTARESYEKHIALVTEAEAYASRQRAVVSTSVRQSLSSSEHASSVSAGHSSPITRHSSPTYATFNMQHPTLRKELSQIIGSPVIVTSHSDVQVMDFVRHPELGRMATQGPATPDHTLRTKRLPMIGRDLGGYTAAYREYFEQHRHGRDLTMIDPAPRIVLDPELGMLTIGRTAKDAAIIEDIYRHTIDIILRAETLGGYAALPAQDIFDVEYWDLEQAKLRRAGAAAPMAGQIALVTGAASGIGRACVASFAARGAAVVGLDINPQVEALTRLPTVLGIVCDVRHPEQIAAALDRTVQAFGGLDMLVLNAGVFGASRPIAVLDNDEWSQVLSINLDANLALMRAAHPLLKLAPLGGRVAVIGSKNVPAPGPGAAAYSASKAALTQLARVAALEWGRDGIRVNVLHPNAVFDTALWTDEVLQTRASSYGLSVEQYKTNNILHVEVTSRDVAELAVALCSPLFDKTTAAQIPVDGGNERVI